MMTTLKRLLAVAIGLFVAFQAPQSVAAPVTISAGQTAIFNFDYTGYTPAAPYYQSWTGWTLGGFFEDGETDLGVIRRYGGLNATGVLFGNDMAWGDFGYHSGFGSTDAMFVDGVYSISFAPTIGSVTIESFPDLWMWTLDGDYVYYEGDPGVVIVGGNDVPEPVSLLLMGSGLLALIAVRRKAGKSI